MIVHFIGAGPGAPDLITVRGLEFIKKAPIVLFAGSLVPKEIISKANDNARVLDTASMNLDEIIELYCLVGFHFRKSRLTMCQ